MTSPNYIITVLPISILKISSKETINSLYKILNKGYEKPTLEYKIVLNPRIKFPEVFFEDLGFLEKQEKCYFYVMVNKDLERSTQFSKTFRQLKFQTNDNLKWYTSSSADLDFYFPIENVLATVGFKYLEETRYEVTGFTSFGKGCGIDIFEESLAHFKKEISCSNLVAKVIMEHNLVGYYESKLGFREVKRLLIKKDELLSSGFEHGFLCTQDFHISILERQLD